MRWKNGDIVGGFLCLGFGTVGVGGLNLRKWVNLNEGEEKRK